MQALIVRPVMTGLLALIIAGFWGAPLGRSGSGALAGHAGCRGFAGSAAPELASPPAHIAPRC
ncbi:MAG TPA: hypothetical protein VN668_11870 [Stellaceae bacterium]|nr:hypothetical protein [Stellaceae bacterium]